MWRRASSCFTPIHGPSAATSAAAVLGCLIQSRIEGCTGLPTCKTSYAQPHACCCASDIQIISDVVHIARQVTNLRECKTTCWRQLWQNTQWDSNLHTLQLPAAEAARLSIAAASRRCCAVGHCCRSHNLLSRLLHLPLEPAIGFWSHRWESHNAGVRDICNHRPRRPQHHVLKRATARPCIEPSRTHRPSRRCFQRLMQSRQHCGIRSKP